MIVAGGPTQHSDRAARRFDLRNPTTRRVLVQEFVSELRRAGASTIEEMWQAEVSLFKIPLTCDELRVLAELARRLGYVEARRPERAFGQQPDDPEWSLTTKGEGLPAPASLHVTHVARSLVRVGESARKGAGDWFAAAAVAVGALAAFDAGAKSDAVRLASIALLAGVVGIHVRADFGLSAAARAWRGIGREDDVERFYGRARVLVTVAFTAAMLFVYGFALFDRTRPWPAVGAGVAATVLFLWLLTRWLVPLWRTDRRLRKGRTSTAWYRPDPADGDEQAAAKDGQQDEVSAGSGQPSARSQPEASVGRGDG